MASNFIPGDRLWVRLEGYDWWPARVLSDEELATQLEGQTRDPGCDLAVLFYAGSQTGKTISQLNAAEQAQNICYFETSSEKAVTGVEDLRVAIQNASDDVTANPIKADQAPTMAHPHTTAANINAANSGGNAAAGAAGALSAKAMRRKHGKRTRDDDGGGASDSDDGDDPYARGHAGSAAYKSLPSTSLKALAQRISEAVAASDVPTLRLVLCDLDRVDVTLTQLEESKIGVAVGNILGNGACRPLWPLARALVSFWARHLGSTTIAAIRRVQEGLRLRTDAGDAIPIPGSPMSPSSPLRLNAFTSPTVAGAAFGGLSSPNQSKASQPQQQQQQRNSFFRMLCQLLDSPESKVQVPSDTIEQVARALSGEVQNPDDRSVLIARLRNADLAFVRENLLTGRWTAKQYAEQPDEAFVTEQEKEAEKRRVEEKMKAFDDLANVGLNLTEMFKCSNCGGRKCTFYEQQTRGADEPTTKFITCMTCKKAWTEE